MSFFLSGFSSLTLTIHRTSGKGRDHLLFHSITSIRLRTLRHLPATLHVRWLSCLFNRNACVYQADTQWDLPHYWITIWVIDWWCNVCLFTWWIDTRFLLQRFDIGSRWIWTRIDYHPCSTGEPTNQACQSPRLIVCLASQNYFLHVLCSILEKLKPEIMPKVVLQDTAKNMQKPAVIWKYLVKFVFMLIILRFGFTIGIAVRILCVFESLLHRLMLCIYSMFK